jgi:hyperosmotically inducible protein
MKPTISAGFLMAAALLVSAAGASTAVASTKTPNAGPNAGPMTDADLAKQVRHEILMYSRYSIWDDVNFRVAEGSVELMGAVNQPYKKSDLGRIVQRIPGVASVTNELKVLPLSNNDDRLRMQVARAIYGDTVLSRYRLMAVPPIHIIVDNGHVTLTGVVNNAMEKQVAGIRASGAGLSFGPVTNNLEVENPPAKKS